MHTPHPWTDEIAGWGSLLARITHRVCKHEVHKLIFPQLAGCQIHKYSCNGQNCRENKYGTSELTGSKTNINGLLLLSRWLDLAKGRHFCWAITERSKAKPMQTWISFGAQMENAIRTSRNTRRVEIRISEISPFWRWLCWWIQPNVSWLCLWRPPRTGSVSLITRNHARNHNNGCLPNGEEHSELCKDYTTKRHKIPEIKYRPP